MNELINEQSDIELYKAFLSGDDESFNVLIKKHRKQLVLFIMKYVKSLEIAEDIAQDSFVYILINRIDYDFQYSFKTYLYTIAKSRAVNYIRKNKKVISINEIGYCIEDNEISIEEKYIKTEEKEILQNAIKKLKKEYQIVIYLYDFQQFKYKEISKILNQSMSKTKMMIHRAKKMLKKIIEEGKNVK